MVTSVPQSRQLLDAVPLPPLGEDDETLPEADEDTVSVSLVALLDAGELPPPPDVPPPPELPPPPDEPPPPDDPPPPLENGEPSVLFDDGLDGLLDGDADPLLPPELDTESVVPGGGEPDALELGDWLLLLRLDAPLPAGCWVVAHTGI